MGMKMTGFFFILQLWYLLQVCFASSKPGVQIRLTRKGLKYLADVGKQTLEKELQQTTFDESGKSGRVTYQIYGARITSANVPVVQLSPKSKVGINGVISGATVGASGQIKYKYKRGIIKFSDHIGFTISINGINIAATTAIGATDKGRFTISMANCNAHIGSIDIKFQGSWKKFIYNLFRHLLEKKMRSKLNADLCNILRKQIDGKMRTEFETFSVISKIDKWAEIDYHLTSSPVYTSNYMDVFSKGEFKARRNPQESKLVINDYKTAGDHNNMIYIWVSEYTVNTAGEVYQKSKQLNATIAQWDEKVPDAIRKQLYTSTLQKFIPNLRKYPNLPISIQIVSKKAPKVVMKEKSIHLFLYADATFFAKQKNGKLVELFVFSLNIDTALNVKIVGKKASGKITEFNYDAKVLKSDIGKIDISLLTSPFVKTFVEHLVMDRVNAQLGKGFPLPQLKDLQFHNAEVKLMQNVVRIGTDVQYK